MGIKYFIFLLLTFSTIELYSQDIHQRTDYYKTDSIKTFTDRVNYHLVYLKVELDTVIKLSDCWKYCYSYKYFLEHFDENSIIEYDSGIIGPNSETFYSNDSAFFFCPKFSENKLYFLINKCKKELSSFIVRNEDECHFAIPGSKVNVLCEQVEGIKITKIQYSKLNLISEYWYKPKEGFIFIKIHIDIFGAMDFKRCRKNDIPTTIIKRLNDN